jgi:diguanylate cyclase (GGDEF)-like protein/PAS domain S-box-containing protein
MQSTIPILNEAFVDLLLDVVVAVGHDGRIMYISAACETIFGYTAAEMEGQLIFDFMLPEDRERSHLEAGEVLAGNSRVGFENRYVRKDRHVVSIMWSARWSELDRVRIGVGRDVTARRDTEARLAATYAISEAAHAALDLQALLDQIHPIVASLMPINGIVVGMASAGQDGADHHSTTSVRLHFDGARLPLAEDRDCALRICAEVLREGKAIQHREPAVGSSADASPQPTQSWLAVPLATRDACRGALLVKLHDNLEYSQQHLEMLQFVGEQIITAIERTRLREELLHQARYDDLTTLPNRRLLNDRLDTALARARREGEQVGVLYIDVDAFKLVNDTFGHAAGDQVLREVARRLKACVREDDTVARTGGDEFVVLAERLGSPQAAQRLAQKIRAAMAAEPAGHPPGRRFTVSIGVAVFPGDATQVEELLRQADHDMYREKRRKAHGDGVAPHASVGYAAAAPER